MGIMVSICAIVAGLGIVFAIPDTGYSQSFAAIAAIAGGAGLLAVLARSPRLCAVLLFCAIVVCVFMPLLFLVAWPVVLYCGGVVVWHAAHRWTYGSVQPTSSRY